MATAIYIAGVTLFFLFVFTIMRGMTSPEDDYEEGEVKGETLSAPIDYSGLNYMPTNLMPVPENEEKKVFTDDREDDTEDEK